mgnify:CR=1 FL=1
MVWLKWNLNLEIFEQAIQYYAKLDNRDLLAMTGVSTYERIGKAYASLGKFEAAREFLEKAIEIDTMIPLLLS